MPSSNLLPKCLHSTLYDIRECNTHLPVLTLLLLLRYPGNDLVSRHSTKRTAQHRRAERHAQARAWTREVLPRCMKTFRHELVEAYGAILETEREERAEGGNVPVIYVGRERTLVWSTPLGCSR